MTYLPCLTVLTVVSFGSKYMASLTRKKDCKNWIAVFTLSNGSRTNRSTGTADKKEAQRIANEFEKAEQDAKAGRFIESAARRTLNDILERHGEDQMHGDTVEHFMREWLKGKVNEGTQERYAHVVDVFLKHLGKKSAMLLSKVSHRDAASFIKSREAQKLATKTIRTDAKILSSVFNLARRLGFIDHNPFEKALALRPINVVSSVRMEFTPEQVLKIFSSAKGEWKSTILFGYFTGARLSDCASMKWSNVNFSKGVIDYIESKHKKRVIMPIVAEFDEYLQGIASTDSTNPFITPSLASKETRGKSGLSESFKRIMVEAGVDPQTEKGQGKRNFSKLSFHSLRHTTNTLLANNGVNQETRMALIGQTTKAVNSDYTHLDLDNLRSAMKNLPSLNLPKIAN